MEKYINPFTDFGFKRLFGTEPNKDLLIDFLNSVVLPKGKAIADLTYAQAEHQGVHPTDRKVVFDLHCTGPEGERFIVEMQKGKQNYFKDRSVYYSTFPIREQAPVGVWDFKLKEVYTVAVLDFVLDKAEHRQEVRHEVWLKDQYGEVFYNKLCFIFLEMPNFELEESQLQTNAEKWLWVMKQLPKLQKRPMTLQGKVFEKLFSAAEIARLSPKERAEYEANMKIYRDYKNTIDTSYDAGQTAGKVEALLAFHRAGVEIATIAKALDMTQAEVQELIEKHKSR